MRCSWHQNHQIIESWTTKKRKNKLIVPKSIDYYKINTIFQRAAKKVQINKDLCIKLHVILCILISIVEKPHLLQTVNSHCHVFVCGGEIAPVCVRSHLPQPPLLFRPFILAVLWDSLSVKPGESGATANNNNLGLIVSISKLFN